MNDLRTAAQAVVDQLKHGWVSESDPVAIDLKAALAQEEQEPVAWAVFEGENAHDLYLPQEYDQAVKMAGYKGSHAEVKPLYTAPPQRKPLTDEEIRDGQEQTLDDNVCNWSFRRGVAFAEQAHGIGGQDE